MSSFNYLKKHKLRCLELELGNSFIFSISYSFLYSTWLYIIILLIYIGANGKYMKSRRLHRSFISSYTKVGTGYKPLYHHCPAFFSYTLLYSVFIFNFFFQQFNLSYTVVFGVRPRPIEFGMCIV